MDLYVERKYVEELKNGELNRFVLLFDVYYKPLYKYVARRVENSAEITRIVRLTFLDALGQSNITPTDQSYLIWLFSLAKPRVWDYIAKASKDPAQGDTKNGKSEMKRKVDDMLNKLSLEEREIFRLKFFEQVSDGDVMTILNIEEGTIGPKIYRVLKRVHFLLFGGAPPAGTFVAAFTSQEEVGLKGAGIAGERIRPQLALALDTMPSGDTPDMDFGKDLGVAIGAGPVLQVLAGKGGRGFLVNQSVKRYLQRVAAAADVPLQLTAFTGGNNDAATLAWSGVGVPAASICLARRYSHSPMEVADLGDAEAAYRLLRAIVEGMDELPAFGFLG